MGKISNIIKKWFLNEYRADQKKIVVRRTLEGTLFEIATALVNIVMAILLIVTWKQGGTDLTDAAFTCGITLIISVIVLVVAYHPNHINMSYRLKTKRQWSNAIRMTRLTALEMPLFLGIPSIYGNDSWFNIIGLAAFVLTDILFSLYIYMIGRNK